MKVTRQTPVSQQIVLILEKRIREGLYKPGERIPSESELSSEFGVSRSSLRTALAKLESTGLLLIKHGEGTFVSSLFTDNNGLLGAIWQYDHLIRLHGKKPSTKAITVKKESASVEIAKKLRLGQDELVVITERLFFADDVPVILTNDYFPLKLFDIPIEQVDFNHSITEILKKYCNQEINYSNAKLEAISADNRTKELLGLNQCAPLLLLREVFYNSREDRPIIFTLSYINTTAISLYQNRPWY
jgi:GntR family transcriptional regulator